MALQAWMIGNRFNKIRYLHRTARDFFERPDVWDKFMSISHTWSILKSNGFLASIFSAAVGSEELLYLEGSGRLMTSGAA
jgi:hypothetical protein